MFSTIKINFSADIFISYHFQIETSIIELCELISTYFTEKIAVSKILEEDFESQVPFENITSLIDASKRVICCITKSYLATNACINEMKYSISSKKPIMFILFENIVLTKYFENNNLKNPIKCDLFLDVSSIDSRTGDTYDELILSIHTLMNCENFVKQKKIEKNATKPINTLATLQVFSKNQGKYYCITNQHGFSCFSCKKPITNKKDQFVYYSDSNLNSKKVGNCVIFMKNYFHRNCFINFKCPKCKNEFKNDKAYKDKKFSLICQECVESVYNEKKYHDLQPGKYDNTCAKCSEQFKNEDFVSILEKRFHLDCLRCHQCNLLLNKNSINEENFYNGLFFCKSCVSKNNNKSKSCIIL